MIILLSVSSFGAELSFYKEKGESFFRITGIPANAKLYVKGRYFVIVVPGKHTKKELIGRDLKDKLFDSFQIENFDNSTSIIIATKQGLHPEIKKNDNCVVIKAKPNVLKAKKEMKYIPPPKDMIAMPFYVSENTFSPVKNIKPSYDETLFFSGIRAFYINNYQLAAAFFKEIIDKYPKSHFFISAYFLLGDCYKSMRQYDLAIKTYNKAIELSPKNDAVAQTLFSVAKIYEKKDMFMSARQIYKRIQKEYAGTSWAFEANFMLGYSYYEENRCTQALKYFLNIRKQNNYYPLSMLLSGECFYREKDYARSVLAYYYMSSKLKAIDVRKHYKELGDIGLALCDFEDYKEANKVFSYLESSKVSDIVEFSYIKRMKCDLKKGDFEDLNAKGNYILKFSKNLKLKEEAKKLLDEAKLKKGQVSKKMIDKILAKYKNDPEVVSLALYVYAQKNYRERNCIETLRYTAKLKKLYPNSEYLGKAMPFVSDCINRLVETFYKSPSLDLLDKIYNYVVLLKPKKVDLCKLSWALIFSGQAKEVENIMHYISDEECRNIVISEFFVETGNVAKSMEIVNNLSLVKPYTYYIDMIFGDINYFNGDYKKAFQLYQKALGLKNPLMQDYLRLRIVKSLIQLKRYEDALNYLGQINTKIYSNKVEFLKGLCLFDMDKFKAAIETFSNLENNLNYKERVLFYSALSYLKLNDLKNAKKIYLDLKRNYPNSQYIKVLESLM